MSGDNNHLKQQETINFNRNLSPVLISVIIIFFFSASCSNPVVKKQSPVINTSISTPTLILSTQHTPTRSATATQTVIPSITPTVLPSGWCFPTGKLNRDILIIGYIPDYQTLNPAWGNCLTDLIYFSIEPEKNGSINASRLNPSSLKMLQEMKSKYGTRIHVSIGGHKRSDNFGAVVTNPKIRRVFVNNLVEFALKYNLDGIDFDWEFPKTESEINGYSDVLKAIKEQGLIVSITLYPSDNFDILPYLVADRIQIMSYNRGLRHSTYEQAIEDLEYFKSLGAPKEKLILGVPFYGRQTIPSYKYFSYSEIVKQHNPPANTDEIDNIYFNGVETIQKKTCYMQKNGYGGIMIWELGQDSKDNSSLLRAIYRAVLSDCNL